VVHPGATVVLSDPMAERRSLAEQLGADAAVVPELLGQEDRYRNFDVVFDTVGGAAILSGSLEVTRAGGRVVLFAHARALERADFDLNQLFKEERSVLATYSGSLAEQETIWRFIESGALDASPLVSHRLSLAQFDRATDLCRNRQALKILLTRE
jgi:threonine dehydrogenase-like Zn-dependent dehydrogenase